MTLRPTIAVARPGAQNGAIDLDGRFPLHPSLQPLKEFGDAPWPGLEPEPLFEQRDLAADRQVRARRRAAASGGAARARSPAARRRARLSVGLRAGHSASCALAMNRLIASRP